MNLLARIFEPLLSDGIAHRVENVADVNRRAARELVRAERAYWQSRLYNAGTPEQVKEAREELDKLDEIEATR